MQQEVTSTTKVPKMEAFWEKHFNHNITPKQNIFDILFGIVIPIVLLIFDPGVFTNTIYSSVKIFSYTAISLGITIFIIWLLVGHKIGIPAITQMGTTRFVNHSIELVLQGNPAEAQLGINNLKKAFWCPTECYLGIIEAHAIASVEGNDERRLFLSKAYKEITGVDLETEFKPGQY